MPRAIQPRHSPRVHSPTPNKGRFPGGPFWKASGARLKVFQGRPMESFVRSANIRLYQKLLEEETDEEKRKVIRDLLAKETMKSGSGEDLAGPGPAKSAPG